MKSLLKHLSPFAPDQSGAVSALFDFGGLIAICDAGGCTGNICGFDEPRWFIRKSAVFSAGLRDMDAILGRDDKLVAKLQSAMDGSGLKFSAIIGTPVPAIIATDFKALKRMAEKRTGLPAITVPATGTRHYDRGASDAWLELFKTFATEKLDMDPGMVGVLGASPLDFPTLDAGNLISNELGEDGWKTVKCYGMGAGLDDVRAASAAAKNIVVSPAGLAAAKYLQKTFGTPYEVKCPWLPPQVLDALSALAGKKTLVIHQQFAANSVRDAIMKLDSASRVTVASWFMMEPEFMRENDFHIESEEAFIEAVANGGYDTIVCDNRLRTALPRSQSFHIIDFPHFAVSGRLLDEVK
ncbi:MAG: nitrogenase molybdenum-iron protein [Lentisphaeria bacterium]|nr:nitrogenase molybdenum-iron protein [Lentisphaeria bacterium]